MQKKYKALIKTVEWLLKFFIPPMVGALVLAILHEINFFYENYDFVILLDDSPIKIFIFDIARSFSTFFYGYYLLVYIPFFIFLVVLQKFNKLSLVAAMVSGFIYALSPLLFGGVHSLNDILFNLDDVLILLALIASGLLCSATYYFLHQRFSVKVGK